jgi:hypothetical protein
MSVSIREELLAHSLRLYWCPLIAVASKPDKAAADAVAYDPSMNRVGIVMVTVFARLSLKLFGEDAVANRLIDEKLKRFRLS